MYTNTVLTAVSSMQLYAPCFCTSGLHRNHSGFTFIAVVTGIATKGYPRRDEKSNMVHNFA